MSESFSVTYPVLFPNRLVCSKIPASWFLICHSQERLQDTVALSLALCAQLFFFFKPITSEAGDKVFCTSHCQIENFSGDENVWSTLTNMVATNLMGLLST